MFVLCLKKDPDSNVKGAVVRGRHYGTLHKRKNFLLKRYVIANVSIISFLMR